MKNNILALSLLLLLPALSPAQKAVSGEPESRVVAAIRSGNADAMVADFYASVDLSTPAQEGTLSKVQAGMILKTFFKNNPPARFDVKQQGSSTDGSRFTIGTYTSSNGKTFRILFLVRKVDTEFKVHMLEIEEE
jgi:hypothetical protein